MIMLLRETRLSAVWMMYLIMARRRTIIGYFIPQMYTDVIWSLLVL